MTTATGHTCKNVEADDMRHDPGWPLLAFSFHGTTCGPWSGDGGVEAYLLSEGYQPGYAGNPAALILGLDIDREVAATVPCPACETTGGDFAAYANTEGGYGVAVAVCPRCNHAGTF